MSAAQPPTKEHADIIALNQRLHERGAEKIGGVYFGLLEDDDHVHQGAASDYLGITQKTLCTWHKEGKGPPSRKFGRSRLYRMGDLRRFLRERLEAED